jgi:hypothetical protein
MASVIDAATHEERLSTLPGKPVAFRAPRDVTPVAFDTPEPLAAYLSHLRRP